MNCVNVNVGYMQVFVIINNVRMMINVGVNAKNELIKESVIKDLFGILVIENVNVTSLEMLANI